MKKIRHLIKTCCLLLSISGFLHTTALAEQIPVTHRQIQQMAKDYIASLLPAEDNQHRQIEIGAIDPRIQIPPCQEQLAFSTSTQSLGQTHLTVRAHCPTSEWYLYFRATVTETIPVVVSNLALSPGAVLNASNLKVIDVNKNQLRNSTFADIDSVSGAKVKRRVRPGQPINPALLCYVCKGDQIAIEADYGGIQVKTVGIAIEDGVVGEQIRVENRRSEKVVIGTIISPGRVTTTF